MTALSDYTRLEASGTWREGGQDRAHDVIVSMGHATLAISDMQDRPLAHWSLPATTRLNPGARPALYAPGLDAQESLEIDDDTMIEALERVHRVISRAHPRRGWLRTSILGIVLAGLLAGGIVWLPGALVRHASAIVPPAVRADTGARLLREITALTGPRCDNRVARAPLSALARRVLGPGQGQLVVLAGGLEGAALLPGEIVLLSHDLIEDFDGPEAAAGFILAEVSRAGDTDPIARLLNVAGPGAALRLLTRGEVPDRALSAYAPAILESGRDMPPEAFGSMMAKARIPVAPYAEARIAMGLPPLAAAASQVGTQPVLDPESWRILQRICDD